MRILSPEASEERKRSLLQWVIHQYIKTSRPVASQAIADSGAFGLSPATIRSALRDLEENGFLRQGHASAGRIPTDKGYRFYVDYLSESQRLAVEEKQRFRREYHKKIEELDNLLAQTSRILSTVSRVAGFALSPRLERDAVKCLDLVGIGPRQILVILVTQSGFVRHFPLEVGIDVTPAKLLLINRLLDEHMVNRALNEVRDSFLPGFERAEGDLRDLPLLARHIFREIGIRCASEELYIDGTSSFLECEVEDIGEIHSVMRVVEEKKRLTRVLQEELEHHMSQADRGGQGGSPHAHVRIGLEFPLREMRNLSLITTTYRSGDDLVGLLGIMGPKRMEYSRMMAMVNFVASLVSDALSHWGEEGRRRLHERGKERAGAGAEAWRARRGTGT